MYQHPAEAEDPSSSGQPGPRKSSVVELMMPWSAVWLYEYDIITKKRVPIKVRTTRIRDRTVATGSRLMESEMSLAIQVRIHQEHNRGHSPWQNWCPWSHIRQPCTKDWRYEENSWCHRVSIDSNWNEPTNRICRLILLKGMFLACSSSSKVVKYVLLFVALSSVTQPI